ncbi:MAG: sodium:proton antiporter [Chloroflexia bacterium]
MPPRLGVAVVAHTVIDGMTWPVAFILGAIVSPPAGVAAIAVTARLGVPRRVVTILEGESLVNDAAALVAYRFAIAAAATGSFVLWEAGLRFIIVAGGGVIVGLVLAWCVAWLRSRVYDPPVENMISLLTSFVTFVAEEIHVSGVLAVVAAGLYLGRRAPRIGSAQARLQGDAVWGMIVFLLNGLIFILIGLQLPTVLDGLEQTDSIGTLAYYAVAVSVTAIVVRVLWVYPATYLPRLLFRSIRERDPSPSPRHVAIVAWTGMRGVVSLAAALALGTDVPQRELLIFLTFCVILATLVLQGLTLPLLIRVLRVGAEADTEHEETEARLRASQAALTRLEQLAGDDSASRT